MTTDNIQAACVEFIERLLCPEQFGYAVTAEVRDAARKALGRLPTEQAQYLNAPADHVREVAEMVSEAKPIYMVSFVGLRGAAESGVWHVASEDAFYTFAEEHRRIVYAAPQQPAPAVGEDEWDRSAAAYQNEVNSDLDNLQRDLALEDAAKLCDANAHAFARYVAPMIRALKSQPDDAAIALQAGEQ